MSSLPAPIPDAEQRARIYWFADGLPALVAGFVSVLLAISIMSRQRPLLALLSIPLTWIAIFFPYKRAVEWLKARITYPRTGYVHAPLALEKADGPSPALALFVEPADETIRVARVLERKRQWFVSGTATAAALAMIFVENRWTFIVGGMVIGTALWIVRKHYRFSPIVIVGIPLLGVFTPIFFASGFIFPYFLAGGGVLLMLDGAIALIRYIRHNPAPKVTVA